MFTATLFVFSEKCYKYPPKELKNKLWHSSYNGILHSEKKLFNHMLNKRQRVHAVLFTYILGLKIGITNSLKD